MKSRYSQSAVLSRRVGELRRNVLRLMRGFVLIMAVLIVYQRTSASSRIMFENQIRQPLPVSIHLISERHCGSKWITAHLNECFGQLPGIHIRSGLTRWKHWFQEDRQGYVAKRVFVVTQFRHVHQWVAAMNYLPYHSPMHYNKTWHEFVTKKWDMPRRGQDLDSLSTNTTCQERFLPNQVTPCLENAPIEVLPGTMVRPLYELRSDGSARPYDNILQLRSDKIKNFLSIRNFERVVGFAAVRYEDMVEQGTASLLQSIERQTGIKPMCQPVPPSTLKRRQMPDEYYAYMKEHVDWKTEALIGYTPDN
ncbi:hypothetical protein MPSEU_000540900 [Mayamaea pseudoterrestris]|nr:hypothetical protein MPSEU_000540900 [Mayamaea pseudoterrestris]